MKRITLDDFTPFFRALYGREREPFPWQTRLAERVVEGEWPKVIALPTASGKTACIDIAVFALACQAHLPAEERTAPRRIFFVVDRRVIVDEAFERANNLKQKLKEAKTGLLKEIADRLRELAGGDEPLACFQLRGGIYRDDNWARTPVQPTVIASTVDQIGSRLLFRGYGLRGGSSWPIHAGLAANDSLVLLDEAHCAKPFNETADAVERYRGWAQTNVARPFVFVTMTATPSSDVPKKAIVRAEADDRAHPVLGPRLKARKPTTLVVVEKAKGANAFAALASELAAQAVALAKEPEFKAIAIIVNRVAVAKMTHALLSQQSDSDAVLMIGRMRSLDRDRVVAEWLKKLSADASGERALTRPVFVVATQCLEVGANLDFDAMVSECASLDALRQRFGRLNRMGRDIPARGMIVIRADQVKPKDEDPIYGAALPATWEWLNQNADEVEATPTGKRAGKKQATITHKQIDFGVAALNKLLAQEENEALLPSLQAPSQSAPVMLPAHIDCWAQTAPAPLPSPDPAVFLHGPERGAPEAQVVWRADLNSESSDEEAWVETVSLCPPTSGEQLAVPLSLFRRWMRGEAEAPDLADVEGGGLGADDEAPTDKQTRRVLRWHGPEKSELTYDPQALRPGDTLIVPATLRGWETFGHIPDPERYADLGDWAHRRARGQTVLRLHPAVIQAWPDSQAKTRLLEIAATGETPEDFAELRQMLEALAETDDTELKTMAHELARDKRLKVYQHPFGGLVLQGAQRRPGEEAQDSFTDEDDTASAAPPATLQQHCEGVSRYAKVFAQGSGLSRELVEDITLAGLLHDFGKGDPRFQVILHGGNRWKAAAATVLMAKSERIPPSAAERNAIREEAGYPKGARHELLSVRLIESAQELLAKAHDPELVLHLVACHHGHCRPFAPVINDASPVDVAFAFLGASVRHSSATGLEKLDSGVAGRFWKLTRKYGWWGLAYLEAMLRLADHRESAEERQGKEAA
jgi:CRISPR-associated endonuclease/helicase Cas3